MITLHPVGIRHKYHCNVSDGRKCRMIFILFLLLLLLDDLLIDLKLRILGIELFLDLINALMHIRKLLLDGSHRAHGVRYRIEAIAI